MKVSDLFLIIFCAIWLILAFCVKNYTIVHICALSILTVIIILRFLSGRINDWFNKDLKDE